MEEKLNKVDETLDKVRDSVKNFSEKVIDNPTFKKYQQSDDRVSTVLEDISKAAMGTVDFLNEHVGPAVKSTKDKVHNYLYDDYKKKGCPYGDTQDGYNKWMKERQAEFTRNTEKNIEKAGEMIGDGCRKTYHYVKNEVNKHSNPDVVNDPGSVKKPESESKTDSGSDSHPENPVQ